MQKTSNFNLNKPEAADPMRLEDFNHNADLIDAALAAAPKIQTGTYIGTGKYGSGNYTTLTLDFPAKFLMIWGPYSHIALGIAGQNISVCYDYSAWLCTTEWNGNTVKWYYSSGAQQQMTENGNRYYYMAIG